jgi:hypothetical protein
MHAGSALRTAAFLFALLIYQSDVAAKEPWEVSLYPDGYDFAFTIVHDADSAYSRRLAPLFEAFDDLSFKFTVTVFPFWADWADKGRIWSHWHRLEAPDREFFAPKAVPLVDASEREFYKTLAARGHEIGMHSASDTSDTRNDVMRAFEYFRQVFGAHPSVYVEHSAPSNKEAQANEGANPRSIYYTTDLLNRYGSWVWVDGPGGLPDQNRDSFYDVIAANGSPFNGLAVARYGIKKAFMRTGRWKEAGGDGFLQWYSEANIDSLARNGGLALVYTHLDSRWLDPETRKLRGAIQSRLRYIASKPGWFVPAGTILRRVETVRRLTLRYDPNSLTITNATRERIDGLTLISNGGKSLRRADKVWRPSRGKIVLGTIRPAETLSFTIM